MEPQNEAEVNLLSKEQLQQLSEKLLVEKRMIIHESPWFDLIDELKNETLVAEPITAIVKKAELNFNLLFPITHRPADEIEIRLSQADGQAVWEVKNKTIASEVARPIPEVKRTVATEPDIDLFVSQLDPQKIGVHRIEKIKEAMEEDEGYRVFIYKNTDGRSVGVVMIHGEGYVETLAVDPEFQGAGYGRAIFSDLKKDHPYLRVAASPNSPNMNSQEAMQKLVKFYKENGFVGQKWSNTTVNLDDLSVAGEWQTINNESILNVSVGQHLIGKSDILLAFFEKILDDPDKVKLLQPDKAKKAAEFIKLHKRERYLEHKLEQIDLKLNEAL